MTTPHSTKSNGSTCLDMAGTLGVWCAMPDPLIPFLDAVRERLAKATPGLWGYVNRLIAEAENYFNRVVVLKDGENIQDAHPVCYQLTTDADGDFIAHAPADLTRLLALVTTIMEDGCENCRRKILEQS